MIRVILERKLESAVLDEALIPDSLYDFQDGLCLLGNLDKFSYDSFNSDQMPAVINELRILMNRDGVYVSHYVNALELAEICQNRKETSLTFTPFAD